VKLSAAQEQEALRKAREVSHEVAGLAQWFCLQCDGLFPGSELVDGLRPAPIAGHRESLFPRG
jgi:hypothetical protein